MGVTDGAFSAATVQAIQWRDDFRCVGCGAASPLNCQHRLARGMGGTSSDLKSTPANGILLCGSGTTGCHGWVEHHPAPASALGWRLWQGEDPSLKPYWDRSYGWRLPDPYGQATYVDPDEDMTPFRRRWADTALGVYRQYLKQRDAA